jgi:hypothetical protein
MEKSITEISDGSSKDLNKSYNKRKNYRVLKSYGQHDLRLFVKDS